MKYVHKEHQIKKIRHNSNNYTENVQFVLSDYWLHEFFGGSRNEKTLENIYSTNHTDS